MTDLVRVTIWESDGDIFVAASHRDLEVERKVCRACAAASAEEEAKSVIYNAIHDLFGALRDRDIAAAVAAHRDALVARILRAQP